MALRNIVTEGDPILRRICRPVDEVTDRIRMILDDMVDTMHDADGVGLAAPQVGVLKKVFVVDVTGEDPMVFINPEIYEADGEQEGYEGCLSLPGKSGIVKRPMHIRVRALDRNMKEFDMEAEELLARAICHETDHLDGRMYVELVEGELVNNEDIQREEEE